MDEIKNFCRLSIAILLFFQFTFISYADTTVTRTPSTSYISNEDVISFLVNTDTPTRIIVICSGRNFQDDVLRKTHSVQIGNFSEGNYECEVQIYNNESQMIDKRTPDTTPFLKFRVYPKNPVLSYEDTLMSSQRIEFSEPKGQKDFYSYSYSITITNTGLTPINNIKIEKWGDTNLQNWIILSPTDISSLPGINTSDYSRRIDVALSIPGSAEERTYKGSIKIVTGNAGTKTIDFSVQIVYPVRLEIEEINSNIKGKLRSGGVYESQIKIKETMGYKKTGKINVKKESPNWMIFNGIEDISNIEPFGETTKTIKVEIPKRNAIPGYYSIRLDFSNAYLSMSFSSSFEIPRPVMQISKTSFEYSIANVGGATKDSFTISESEGYMPIEGLKISLTQCKRIKSASGEETSFNEMKDWITFEGIGEGYVSPKDSISINLNINPVEGKGLGDYWCDGNITSKYAGGKNIKVKFKLVNIEIIKSIEKLQNLKLNVENSDGKDMIDKTITLLKKIINNSGTDFISPNVIAFFSSAENVKNLNSKQDYKSAYKEIETLKSDLDSIKKSNQDYPKYSEDLTAIKIKADGYSKYIISPILSYYKNEGDGKKENNLKYSLYAYNNALTLCTYIYCENENIIRNKINEVKEAIGTYENTKYENERKIELLKKEISAMTDSVIGKTDFFGIAEKYDEMILSYDKVKECLEKIGGTDESYRENITSLTNEKNRIEGEKFQYSSMFFMFASTFFIFFIVVMQALLLGMLKYKKDKEDIESIVKIMK